MKKNNTMPSTSINLDIMAGGKAPSPHSNKDALIISGNTKEATILNQILENVLYNVSIKSDINKILSAAQTTKYQIVVIDSALMDPNAQLIDQIKPFSDQIILLIPKGKPELIKTGKNKGIENFIIQPLEYNFCQYTINNITRDQEIKQELIRTLEEKPFSYKSIDKALLTLKSPIELKEIAKTSAFMHPEPEKSIFPIYKLLLLNYVQSNMDFKFTDYESFSKQGIYEEDLIHISSLRNKNLVPTHITIENKADKTLLTLSSHNINARWIEELKRKKLFDELHSYNDQITVVTNQATTLSQ